MRFAGMTPENVSLFDMAMTFLPVSGWVSPSESVNDASR
jgi:hypothetical protein